MQSSFKDNICEGCEGKIQLDGISDPIGFELYNNGDGISIFIEGQEFTFSGKEFTTMHGNEAKQNLLSALRTQLAASDLAKELDNKHITSLSAAISRAWVHSLNATDILTSQDKTVHDLATFKGLEDISVQEEVEDIVVPQEEEEKEDEEFVEKTTKEQRISSGNSDYNERKLAKLYINELYEQQLINQEIYTEAQKDPVSAINVLNNKLKITPEKLQDIKDKVLLEVIRDPSLETLATPTLLADYYERTKNKLSMGTIEKAKIQETKQNLETVKEHMEYLLQKFVLTGALDVYSYTDTLNIGDVYEGYIKMAEILKSTSQNNNPTVEEAEKILKAEIEKYDQLWRLDGIEKIDLAELTERFEKVSKLSKELKVTDETMELLSKVTFLDEQGNPQPQFLDANGNETATFTAGCTIKPGSKLSTIIDFARNNTVLSNLTTDPAPTKEALEAEFQFHVYKDLYAVGKTEEAFQSALKGLGHTVSIDDLDYSSVEKIASSVKQQLENSENLTISDAGFKAAIETEVNNTMMCIDRVGTKLNNKASLLLKRMHDPIAKYDTLKDQRFESPKYTSIVQDLKNGFKTFAITAGSTLVMKGGTWALAKFGGLSVPMAAGILATTIAGVSLGINASKYIKRCRAENKKPTLREFFSPKSSEGRANIATCLGCAAGACLIAGQPVAAAVCGVAAIGVNAYNFYKGARDNGATRLQALRTVAINATAIVGGVLFGNAVGNAVGFNNFTKTETKIVQKEGTNPSEAGIQKATDSIYEPRWNDSDQLRYIEAFDSEAKVDLALQNIKNASIGNPNLCNIEGVPNAEVTLFSAEQVAYTNVGDKIPAIPTADGSYTFDNYMADLRSPTGPTDIQAFQHMAQNVNYCVNPETGHVDVGIFGHEHNGIRTLQPFEHSSRFVTQQVETTVSTNVHIGPTAAAIFMAPKRAIQKLKERIGALADKRKKTEQRIVPTPPNPKLKEEYEIVYGIEPNEQSYKSYYARVEQERLQQPDPQPEMDTFLQQRRENLEKVMAERGMDKTMTVERVRENLMQSNITEENFTQVITLSHFTKWAKHVVAKDEVAADGSKSLRKGPVKFKRENEDKKVVITDVNKYLVEGKELSDPDVQHTVARRDIRDHITKLEKTYDRQRQLPRQQRSR